MSDLLLPSDFQLLFEASPHPYLILRPDAAFTIVAANERYLAATGTRRNAIVGHGVFDIFPDNPEDSSGSSVSDLRASLNRVMADRCPDVMGVQKYDIPRRDGNGEFEVRYWSPVNTPVFGPAGDLRFITHYVEDVTEFILGHERASHESAERIHKIEARAERSEAEVLRQATELKEANRALKRAKEVLEQRAEEQLRDSEEKYRSLFANMTEGFALGEPILDDQGRPIDYRFLEINEAFYEQTGVPRGIQGRPLREALPQLERTWTDRYAAAALNGQSARIESYNADTQHYYETYCFCPSPGRFAILFRDITEQKHIQEALLDREQRYTALFNNKTMGVAHQRFITDPQGRPVDYYYEAMNDVCLRIIGMKREETIGRRATEVFPGIRDFDFDFIGEFGRIALQGGEGEFEYYFPPLRQWISLYAYSPKHGECTAIFTDITAQKEAEAAILRVNADLEQRVADRTRALTQANEALLHSNEELQRFAYIASHDLQTPLRTITGFSQILQKDYKGRLDERADEYLDRVVDGTRRLHLLIRDLLAYSRVDSQARPFETVELQEIFQSVVASLAGSIQEAGAEITHGDLPRVLGDRSQLTQLLQNLIENGLKYRGPEPPHIHAWAERQPGGWRVSVRDNGIGIDPKHHEAVFEVFRRLHTPQAYPGTGIGLSVCRRVVERHGGRIWVESDPGRGSVFHFTLPIAKETDHG